MFRPKILILAVLLSSLSGCVTDQAHRYYVDEHYPPTQATDVEVLWETPKRPHLVIADFQARGASIEYMRKKAAEIGADAILVGMYGGYRAKSDEWAHADKYSDTYSRITATAIRFKR